MKLELKHLAPYLPYELQLYGASDIWIMHSLGIEEICLVGGFNTQTLSFDDCLTDYSPILRPLSDLTQEIEHNGEKFVPMQKLRELFGGRPISFDGMCFYTRIEDSCVRSQQDVVPLHFSQYDAFQKLFEWHFDVFGLLENNLAEKI